jgi:hypothetical protein
MRGMGRSAAAAVMILAIGCRPTTQAERVNPPRIHADSISLERTACFGWCPVYRLSLTARGRVSFVSGNPQTNVIDSISTGAFSDLVRGFEEIQFGNLPNRIQDDRGYCGDQATDHATAILTIFADTVVKRVVDYLGCSEKLDWSHTGTVGRLRALENRVDSVAGSSRWITNAARSPRR